MLEGSSHAGKPIADLDEQHEILVSIPLDTAKEHATPKATLAYTDAPGSALQNIPHVQIVSSEMVTAARVTFSVITATLSRLFGTDHSLYSNKQNHLQRIDIRETRLRSGMEDHSKRELNTNSCQTI